MIYLWTAKACNHEENELVLENGQVVNETYIMWSDFPIVDFEYLLRAGIVRPLDTLAIRSFSHHAKLEDTQYLVVAKLYYGDEVILQAFTFFSDADKAFNTYCASHGKFNVQCIIYNRAGEEVFTWGI